MKTLQFSSVSYLFAFSYCSWGSQGKNAEVVCHSLLQWTTFCQTSPPWPIRLGWPHTAWPSFIELDKAGSMWSDWLVFCDVVFSLSALWRRRIRALWKLPDGRDWLRGKLGFVLMGGAILSKSLIQFAADGLGYVPSQLFDLRSNYGGGNEDNGDLLQKVPCMHCYTQCAPPFRGQPMPLLETWTLWASLDQSLGLSL